MITVTQIRSARAAVRWTINELAKASGVSVRTIKSIETSEGNPDCRASTLHKIQSALELAGIEFIGSPDDRPGIRIGRVSGRPE
jgi:transcriptional regulator with XRE-family HTH domain